MPLFTLDQTPLLRPAGAAQGRRRSIDFGKVWTIGDTDTTEDWAAVAFGNNTFVAVQNGAASTASAITSSDGVTWTPQTTPNLGGWSGIAFGNNIFVAVREGGTTSNTVMTSPDGVTWTTQTTPQADFWRVKYANGVFMAIARSGANRAMTSPDGVNWTLKPLLNNDTWIAHAYGAGKWVVIGNANTFGSAVVATSIDNGATWSVGSTGITKDWSGLCFGNDLFVAVHQGGTNTVGVMTSPDGATWTQRTTPSSGAWQRVIWANSIFVATSAGQVAAKGAMSSKDGVTWTLRTTGAATYSWRGLAYGNGVLVGVGVTGASGRTMYSAWV